MLLKFLLQLDSQSTRWLAVDPTEGDEVRR